MLPNETESEAIVARRMMGRMTAAAEIAPIRTAVVGYGLAGRVFHCPFITAVPGLELAAIVQRRGDEAGNAYPGVKVVRDVREVLQDETIDLVVVGTPNTTHFELATQVLQASKHCVVDKPFAATGEECVALQELSRKMGKLAVPFHNRRFDGDFLTLKRLLTEEALGRVVEIHSRFDRFRPQVRENSWKEESGAMSGLFFDLGTHLLDQALALFGAPDSVDARIYRDRVGTGIDDSFEVTLEYASRGMRFRCGSTLLAADPQPRFRVNGTKGSYTKYGVDPQEAAVGGGRRPPVAGSGDTWLAEPKELWGMLTMAVDDALKPNLRQESHPTIPGDYRMFYENVRDAIRGTTDLLIRPEDGYRCIRLIELAMQSDAERRSIPVQL